VFELAKAMAGIAASTAEIYARYNIPSIPLDEDKRPLVGRFKIATLSMAQSRAFIRRRPEATALGIPDGRLSGIVRLDIDELGEDVKRAVIDRAGDTPAKVRTASGKYHLIYGYNGERRLTGTAGRANARPWPDMKVDLCGDGGFSVSPPSLCKGSTYELLGELTLEELLAKRHLLPTIKGLDARAFALESTPDIDRREYHQDLRQVGPGNRDAVFYREVARICQRTYRDGGSMDDVLVEAMERHAEFPIPHKDAEKWVRDKVKYWWGKTIAGENKFGIGARRPCVRDWKQELAGTDPALYALLAWLKEENGPESEFQIANGMIGAHLNGWWSIDRLRNARQRAIQGGWIKQTVTAAQGRHALYRWGPTAFATIFA
jgi:hypothetical protein